MRTLQGCKAPSRKRCLVSDIWMPPRGALGSVLAGTSARQYTPTWWMLSMAWKQQKKTGGQRRLWRKLLACSFVQKSRAQYLKDTTHPLEAVFLRGVRSLLCHNDNPLIMQHWHRKHSYPGTHNVKQQLHLVDTVWIFFWRSGRVQIRHTLQITQRHESVILKVFHVLVSFTSPCTQTS